MDDTTRPAPARRDPASLAPSVDRTWAQDFILEQRLLDVPGDRIGDALVTIETHVAESGESAQDTFGDARAYARELADAEIGPGSRVSGIGVRTVVSLFIGLIGVLLTNAAFESWLSGSEVSLSWGHLAAFTLTLLILATVVSWSSRVLRVITTRTWVTAAVLSVLILVSIGLMVRMPEAAIEGPTVVVGLAGLALLAVGSLLSWTDNTDDPVLAPGESPSAGGRLLGALTMPIAAAIVLGLTGVLHLLA